MSAILAKFSLCSFIQISIEMQNNTDYVIISPLVNYPLAGRIFLESFLGRWKEFWEYKISISSHYWAKFVAVKRQKLCLLCNANESSAKLTGSLFLKAMAVVLQQ